MVSLRELLQLYSNNGAVENISYSPFGFRFNLDVVKSMRRLIDSIQRSCDMLVIVQRALMSRISIADIFATRAIVVPHSLFPICNRETEQIDHLLVKCEFAQVVCDQIFRWCGFQNWLNGYPILTCILPFRHSI